MPCPFAEEDRAFCCGAELRSRAAGRDGVSSGAGGEGVRSRRHRAGSRPLCRDAAVWQSDAAPGTQSRGDGFRAETVVQDLRFALRQLRRSPGFAVTAILVLALGIGASTAIFGFVDAVLIQPLPYAESEPAGGR